MQFFEKRKISASSTHIVKGSIFFAFSGANSSVQKNIYEAVDRGASEVVVEKSFCNQILEKYLSSRNVILTASDNLHDDLLKRCLSVYGNIFSSITIIGVTGTKGKSSTVFYTAYLLNKLGYRVAYLSTLHNCIDGEIFETNLTTNPLDYIFSFLYEAVLRRIDYVIIEVSAQAVTKKRVYGIPFDHVIFTNFSPEHSEFYQTPDEYFSAKTQLFSQIKNGGKLIFNGSDSAIKKWVISEYKGEAFSYGNGDCHETIQIVKMNIRSEMTDFCISYDGIYYEMKTNIFGAHVPWNISAILTLFSILFSNSFHEVMKVISNESNNLPQIPGRCERYRIERDITVCIDRAHTPESFLLLMKTLRSITNHLVVLFGCGGNRDKRKRPLIAEIVEEFADIIVVTEDNPRSEPLKDIIRDIILGFSFKKPVHIIIDREEAIRFAISLTNNGGMLALVGKGEEQYQERNGNKFLFSEKEIVQRKR